MAAPAQKTTPPASKSAAPQSHSLGAVRPSNLVLPQFAVSSFAGDGGDAIGQTVQRDLALADVLAKATNAAGTATAAAQDQRTNSVNYDGWVAAGVHYVLRGSIASGSAEAELHDVAARQRVFGKSYRGFKDGSRAAHRIADDIMTALTNQPGIFSSQICCLVDRGNNRREVCVMDPDGGNLKQLSNENAIVATPCWGKSGTEIYYTSYRENNPDLYGITLAGRRFDISRRPGLNTSPSWNESLQRLAVTLSKDGNSELYTMDRNGGGLARLTNSPDADTAADWSPDGSQVAFTSDRGGSPQIYVMSAGGGEARRISGGGYCDSPTWSPDGQKIAYVVREEGGFNIYVARLNGAPALQITRGARDNTDPSWAPDSRHLVFSSTRDGSKALYMVNMDSKVARRITQGGGYTGPCWGPILP